MVIDLNDSSTPLGVQKPMRKLVAIHLQCSKFQLEQKVAVTHIPGENRKKRFLLRKKRLTLLKPFRTSDDLQNIDKEWGMAALWIESREKG